MDILAIRPAEGGGFERWHYEVSGAFRAMSYLSPLPEEVRRSTHRGPRHAGYRPPQVLKDGVREFVEEKFLSEKHEEARRTLCRGRWEFGLVYAKVKHEEELPIIEAQGIKVKPLQEITDDLQKEEDMHEGRLKGAAGSDLVDLIFWEQLLQPRE